MGAASLEQMRRPCLVSPEGALPPAGKVLVTAASGAVGSEVLAALRAAGTDASTTRNLVAELTGRPPTPVIDWTWRVRDAFNP